MESNIKELISILEQQINLYKDLLELSRSKTKVIIEGKVNDLDKITKVEQAMIVDVGKLENIRIKATDILCSQLGIQNSSTMTDLAEYIKDEESHRQFVAIRDALSKVLDELSAINRQNGELIIQSLQYIDFNINVMTGSGGSDTTYDSKSLKGKDTQTKRIFDARI